MATSCEKFSPVPLALAAFLTALTVFLSGEQNERSGIVHLPAMLWLLAAAGWTLLPVLRRRPTSPLRFNRLDGCVYAFFAYVILSLLWNLLPGQGGAPRPSLNMLSTWILMATAWYFFRQVLQSERDVVVLLAVVFAVLFAETILGLYQQFVDFPQMLRQFEADPAGTMAAADPSIQPGSTDWLRMEARLRTAAPMGTYPISNSLGGLLGCGLVLLLGGFLAREKTRWTPYDVFLVVMTLLLAACFLLTKSRSAYVATAVGLLLLPLTLYRDRLRISWRRATLGAGVGGLVLTGVFVAIAASGHLGSGKTVLAGAKKSLGFRLEYWQASLGMIADAPVFGCGSGNFKQAYTRHKLPWSSEEISDPHNFAVEIAAASGLPALALFVLSLGGLLIFSGRSARCAVETQAVGGGGLAAALVAGLGGCWLAFLLSFASEAPMDFVALGAATLVFLVAIGLCRFDAGQTQRFPVALLATAAGVLLVHLLASGGISASSTAIVLWLLPAAIARTRDTEAAPTGNERAVRRGVRLSIGTVLLVGVVVVHLFGVRPVLGAFSYAAEAEAEPYPPRRVTLLRQAVARDPWSSTLQDRLATESFRGWTASPDNAVWKDATLHAQQQALRLCPRSASLHFVYAERLSLAARQTGDAALRDRALALYARAIELYPNKARFRASYAVTLREAGRDDEAQCQHDAALALDALMPHADQKLN